MTHNTNPFLYGRSEHERGLNLYVTGGKKDGEFFEWVSDCPLLFEGVRGSGKSSILRSLDWDVAWGISTTKIKGPAPIQKYYHPQPGHLGIRYGFDEMDTLYWEHWKTSCGLECAQRYFCTFLEYGLLDLFLRAMIKLIHAKPHLLENSQSESGFVTDLLQAAFTAPNSRPQLYDQSLEALSRTIRDQWLGIRDRVYREVTKEEMYDSYPVLSPGSLVKEFAECLSKYYPQCSGLKIFPLLDDCDRLTEWQTRVINSAVYRAVAPVAYKMTSVLNLYKTRKTMDGEPLNERQLKTILISGTDLSKWDCSDRFSLLANGVCKTRIAMEYDPEVAKCFDLKQVLGKYDIDSLLETVIKNRNKPKALELYGRAVEKAKKGGDKISIIRTWLSESEVRSFSLPRHTNKKVQRALERRIRDMYPKKWSHVAAVAICNDLDIPFPYLGWNVVLHLASGSVRELLAILSEIWNITPEPSKAFFSNSKISPEIQRKAVVQTSHMFLRGLHADPLFDVTSEDKDSKSSNGSNENVPPTSLPSICIRLGELFSQFQCYPQICVTPECASLKVKKSQLEDDIRDVINFAVKAGAFLLNPDKEDDSWINFGLHPILAPNFNMSYRSPFYYSESISGSLLNVLFKGSDDDARHASDNILTARLHRMAPSNAQQEFFDIIEGA